MFPFWRKTPPSTIVEKFEPAHSGPASSLSSRSVPDAGPWTVREWVRPGSIALQSKDPRHEVALIVDGAFDSPEQRLAYANELAAWLNQQLAQPASQTVATAEAAKPMTEAPASRLSDAPEPELVLADDPLRVEPVIDDRPEPAFEAAQQPLTGSKESQSLGQRVTKLIHSTSFPLGRKPAAVESTQEPAPKRAEQPSQELADVVCAPSEEVPVSERKVEGPCACHFDLQPGQQPDACVIDLGHPECCTIALSGVDKELCPHWLPIRFVPRESQAQT